MAVKVTGMDIFQTQLAGLVQDIQKINRGGLGEAAGYVADQMKEALEGMPVRPDKDRSGHRLYGATESEKQQIIQNFGISTFKDSGDHIETAIGFHGYVNTPSAKFNDHVPTGMLMQCIEYGTSFRRGIHLISKMQNKVKDGAAEKARKYIEEKIAEKMEE